MLSPTGVLRDRPARPPWEGPVFEFRLRILEAGPSSYLGIVEELPEMPVHAATPEETEGDLVCALIDRLKRMMNYEATRIQLDNLPTVRISHFVLGLRAQ